MAKQFEFQWQIPVPEYLQNGAIFDRWDEVSYQLLIRVIGVHCHCQQYHDLMEEECLGINLTSETLMPWITVWKPY